MSRQRVKRVGATERSPNDIVRDIVRQQPNVVEAYVFNAKYNGLDGLHAILVERVDEDVYLLTDVNQVKDAALVILNKFKKLYPYKKLTFKRTNFTNYAIDNFEACKDYANFFLRSKQSIS